MQELFHNCLSVEKAPGGWLPRHFTRSQIDYYCALSEHAGIRARCSSGITLDFFSDSETLSFSFLSEGFCRRWLAFDLFEDGRLLHSAVYREAVSSGRVVFRRGHGGRAHFTLHLPQNCQITLTDVDFGNFSPAKTGRSGRMWCLGDSITQGMEGVHPSQTYTALLGELLQMDVLNLAIGGIGFKDFCMDFSGLPEPDVVTVALGTNDGTFAQSDWAAYAQRTGLCIDRIREAAGSAPVTLISPFWRGDLEKKGLAQIMARIRELLQEQAARAGFHFVDGLSILPHAGDFCGDGILHPNDLGFSICARVLAGEIRH